MASAGLALSYGYFKPTNPELGRFGRRGTKLRSNTRFRLLGVAAVGLSLALVACGGGGSAEDTSSTTRAAGSSTPDELAELVAAAQEEGSVTIYSSQGLDPLNAMGAAFEEEYGVRVEVVRGTQGDLVPRVEAEVATGNRVADVVVSAHPSWTEDHGTEGWFVAPTGPQFESGSGYDADAYVHEGNYFEVGAGFLTFAWNTDLHPDGLESYEDLLDPKLAGRIGVIDAAVGPAIVDFYLWAERNLGEDLIEQLAAQKPRLCPSALPITEALGSGEIVATIYAAPQSLAASIEAGAPVAYGVDERGRSTSRRSSTVPPTRTPPSCWPTSWCRSRDSRSSRRTPEASSTSSASSCRTATSTTCPPRHVTRSSSPTTKRLGPSSSRRAGPQQGANP